MKKTTITISYDEEKMNALKLYLEQKGMNAEDELIKSMNISKTISILYAFAEYGTSVPGYVIFCFLPFL